MPKNLYLLSGLAFLLLRPALVHAQQQERIVNGVSVHQSTSDSEPNGTPIGVKRLKFGVGLGPSMNLRPTYSYTLLAPDYALSKDNYSPMAGVVSGVVIYNKTTFFKRKSDGELYSKTRPISALLAVNLASYATNMAGNGSGFNSRLDLGLGVGFRFEESFQLGLFLDLASQRFLRESYEQYLGKPVPDYKPTQNLTALDLNDDHYFISRTVPSLSFKLIYTITSNQPTRKEERAAESSSAHDTGTSTTPPQGSGAAPVAVPPAH